MAKNFDSIFNLYKLSYKKLTLYRYRFYILKYESLAEISNIVLYFKIIIFEDKYKRSKKSIMPISRFDIFLFCNYNLNKVD